ncbi:DUF4882 family protein [Acinetobacter beijerinckii]|uniref:DUF4882 family protein n=1 Tax=Acinetobacter TaxID=469 RepID=UPI0020C8869D|nr:DUF4882 family protein [Acinetobacter sp. Z1]UTO18446.1 DUF4882 domain-containing protein [Acinetobacter sp. Z1]
MKKIILGTLISVITIGNTFAACTYNLNATQSQVDAVNALGGRQATLMPTINLTEQKGTAVIGHFSNSVDQIATSSNFISNTSINTPINDKVVVNTNILASEFVFDVANIKDIALGASHEIQQLGLQILGASSSKNELSLDLAYSLINNDPNYSNGSYITLTAATTKLNASGQLVAKDFDRKLIPVTVPSVGKVRVGMYFNQVTKQLGYIINGTNYGYLNILAENALSNIGFQAVSQPSPNTTSRFLGKQVSIQVITNSANMQFTYPSNTKDICGNTI